MIKVSDPPHSLYELRTVNHSCSQTHFWRTCKPLPNFWTKCFNLFPVSNHRGQNASWSFFPWANLHVQDCMFFLASSVFKGVIHPPHPTPIQLLHFSGNAMICTGELQLQKRQVQCRSAQLVFGRPGANVVVVAWIFFQAPWSFAVRIIVSLDFYPQVKWNLFHEKLCL